MLTINANVKKNKWFFCAVITTNISTNSIDYMLFFKLKHNVTQTTPIYLTSGQNKTFNLNKKRFFDDNEKLITPTPTIQIDGKEIHLNQLNHNFEWLRGQLTYKITRLASKLTFKDIPLDDTRDIETITKIVAKLKDSKVFDPIPPPDSNFPVNVSNQSFSVDFDNSDSDYD